ncbi:hypothetical protein WICPIJ_006750 [Wickerhamomyces pijperi]|uniref:Uncharacterized protein n=1 Tax=Wickerhamomyces pijperi TaxID=599730 RepID=A0A9P8TL40_WICPI|nr:hypothetical protein WICPIJ_006750 [Wickerhamomyces pijperi]
MVQFLSQGLSHDLSSVLHELQELLPFLLHGRFLILHNLCIDQGQLLQDVSLGVWREVQSDPIERSVNHQGEPGSAPEQQSINGQSDKDEQFGKGNDLRDNGFMSQDDFHLEHIGHL